MFRVEKPCGTGPYKEPEDHPMLEHMYQVHGDADHPAPDADPLLTKDLEEGIMPDEKCGFATLCALREWFSGYEDPLAELGYEITIYTVPLTSVRFGTQQAVFRYADAEPVEYLSLN